MCLLSCLLPCSQDLVDDLLKKTPTGSSFGTISVILAVVIGIVAAFLIGNVVLYRWANANVSLSRWLNIILLWCKNRHISPCVGVCGGLGHECFRASQYQG